MATPGRAAAPRDAGPVRDRMFHLELMITRQCALRCSYCQVDRRQESMPPETLRPAIELLLTSRSDDVDLLFYGGEPLERLDLVRQAVDFAEGAAAAASKRVRYILITNGLHLDQAVLASFPPGRLQVYLNLVGFSPPARPPGAGVTPAGLSAQTVKQVAMLAEAGVWQCANLVADPEDLGTFRRALDALAAARVPRLQVFPRLGVEWPQAPAAALLEELARLLREGTGAPRLFNAEERMAPFLSHNDAVVDCDGEIYWSAGIWLEQGFPELKRACRIGRVGETATLDTLWRSPDDIRRLLLEAYPPGAPRRAILRNNLELGDALCALMDRGGGPAGDRRPDERPSRSFFLCSTEAGCPVNLSLTTQLHNYVVANRWSFQDLDSADNIILVNCSTLPEYRRRVPSTIEYLARRYPSKSIVVAGCFVDQDRIAAANVTYVAEPRKDELDRLFSPIVPLRDVPRVSTADDDSSVRALRGPDKVGVPFNVTVATGCCNHCAYCIQKRIFASVRSLPLAEIVALCREGKRKGYTHFIISGADVASYGRDLGLAVPDLFAALFDEVLGDDRDLRLAFHAFEPAGLVRHFAQLRDYFRDGRISSIRLPVQSGSDSVLKSMNRNYRIRDVMDVVAELRTLAPAMRIDTDLLFCYPTETRADFEATLALVDHFDEVSLIVFGKHEQTPAHGLADVFDADEKARRIEVIDATPRKPACRERDGVLGGRAIAIQLPSALGPSKFFFLPGTLGPPARAAAGDEAPAVGRAEPTGTPDEPAAAAPTAPGGVARDPEDPAMGQLRRLAERLTGTGIGAEWDGSRLDLVFADDAQADGTSKVTVAKADPAVRYYRRRGDLVLWYSGHDLTPGISGVIARVLRLLEQT
jgi:tRNA A37 methylthiotransferase MiaB